MANWEARATARQLAHVALFQGLSEDTLVRIAGLAHAKSLAPFELFFSEGEQAEAFFVLTSARVKLAQLTPGGPSGRPPPDRTGRCVWRRRGVR
jgi:hypothetical protein